METEELLSKLDEDIKRSLIAEKEFSSLKNTNANEMINAVTNKTTLDLVTNDEETKKKIVEHSKQQINNEIEINNNKAESDKIETKFKCNKEACKTYGVVDAVPLWQQRMMVVGYSIWFVIYFIVATFTIAPISIFAQKLTNIFVKSWLSILVAVVLYLAVVIGIPTLTALLT